MSISNISGSQGAVAVSPTGGLGRINPATQALASVGQAPAAALLGGRVSSAPTVMEIPAEQQKVKIMVTEDSEEEQPLSPEEKELEATTARNTEKNAEHSPEYTPELEDIRQGSIQRVRTRSGAGASPLTERPLPPLQGNPLPEEYMRDLRNLQRDDELPIGWIVGAGGVVLTISVIAISIFRKF